MCEDQQNSAIEYAIERIVKLTSITPHACVMSGEWWSQSASAMDSCSAKTGFTLINQTDEYIMTDIRMYLVCMAPRTHNQMKTSMSPHVNAYVSHYVSFSQDTLRRCRMLG